MLPVSENSTHQEAWQTLNCHFKDVEQAFPECWQQALDLMPVTARQDYLQLAGFLGKTGRGSEMLLVFLQVWPNVYPHFHQLGLEAVKSLVDPLWKTPNWKALPIFFRQLPELMAIQLNSQQLQQVVQSCLQLAERTTPSIHGGQPLGSSECLLAVIPRLGFVLSKVPLEKLESWFNLGIHLSGKDPSAQKAYFSLQSPESRLFLQRLRSGVLFHDHEKSLTSYLKALWDSETILVAYPTLQPDVKTTLQQVYMDADGIRLPDFVDSASTADGLDLYRLMLAHLLAHQKYSQPRFADNLSPLQRTTIESFEDIRMDLLLLKKYPGLAGLIARLHPQVKEEALANPKASRVLQRLSFLSHLLLVPGSQTSIELMQHFVERFCEVFVNDPLNQDAFVDLALNFVTQTRSGQDQQAEVAFVDTRIPWRDDNRHLWVFIEEGDEEESFNDPKMSEESPEGLPARLYPEWDYQLQDYRPDEVSLYEALVPSGSPGKVEGYLERNAGLIKRITQLINRLKPQNSQRIRYQEKGNELDTDALVRTWLDMKNGNLAKDRIYLNTQNEGRSLAVLLLLDLSHSLNDRLPGSATSLLELSEEAVALLSFAVSQLGDSMAIAGFNSNTRHQVRYHHIKGFREPWGATVKGRLGNLEASYSTRMGAALRHAGQYLNRQTADRKILLVLSDGQPSDIDVQDDHYLIADAAKAIQELKSCGINSHAIHLDALGEDCMQAIFGHHYSLIKKVECLPAQLPSIFLSLTKSS